MESIKKLSIEDFAAIRGCSPRTVRNILWSDKRSTLPPVRKLRKKLFFLQHEVDEWLKKLPVINAPKPRRGRPRKTPEANEKTVGGK